MNTPAADQRSAIGTEGVLAPLIEGLRVTSKSELANPYLRAIANACIDHG